MLFLRYGSRQTDRQTYTLMAVPRPLNEGEVIATRPSDSIYDLS